MAPPIWSTITWRLPPAVSRSSSAESSGAGPHDARDGVDGVLADRKELFGAGDPHRQHPRVGLVEVSGHGGQHLLHAARAAARSFGEHEQCLAAAQPVVRDLDRAARGAGDLARVHDGVLRRARAALRRLDRSEAQAREAALQAGVDLGPGDDRQPVGERRRAAARQQHFDQVRVRIRQVVGEDDDTLAGRPSPRSRGRPRWTGRRAIDRRARDGSGARARWTGSNPSPHRSSRAGRSAAPSHPGPRRRSPGGAPA